MKMHSALRTLALVGLHTVALSAHATDAYSNLAGPFVTTGQTVAPTLSIGFQFTSGLTGALSSLSVAIGSVDPNAPAQPFALSLYADNAGTLGTLLGSYSAMTNEYFGTAAALDVVPASGVTLTAGTSYWLVATTTSDVVWNYVDAAGTAKQPGYFAFEDFPVYTTLQSSAFSVQANPVPEPTTFVALGLGVLGFLRRRRI